MFPLISLLAFILHKYGVPRLARCLVESDQTIGGTEIKQCWVILIPGLTGRADRLSVGLRSAPSQVAQLCEMEKRKPRLGGTGLSNGEARVWAPRAS
jgi:hypothetical protein